MKSSFKEFLLRELSEVRKELIETASKIKLPEYDWHPRHDMKSAKDLLVEICGGEVWINTLMKGKLIQWDEAEAKVKSEDLQSILNELDNARKETIDFLNSKTDEELFNPIENLPQDIKDYWKGDIIPAEAIEFTLRHEYYHLGQLIYNRWLLGYNPYKE